MHLARTLAYRIQLEYYCYVKRKPDKKKRKKQPPEIRLQNGDTTAGTTERECEGAQPEQVQ